MILSSRGVMFKRDLGEPSIASPCIQYFLYFLGYYWLIKIPIFAILLLILITWKGEVPARSWRDTTSLPRLVVVASMAMRDGDRRTTLDMNKLAPENEQFGSKIINW